MPNRLAGESSPYLQQHKDNPVDWFPWGSDALDRAKREDKPILVSIGYSSCHWCHVMAHESFEDPAIAALMNERFINIKVDREERPDIDSIYMTALQAMSGQGGWPLNVFLTPEAVPFFGGTYWPPRDSRGMPGFPRVLEAVHQAFTRDRAGLEQTASKLLGYLSTSSLGVPGGETATADVATAAIAKLRTQFDQEWGGFGGAPKFPQASVFTFLLRHQRRTGSAAAREMITVTLDRMTAGGMYDQVGGGFARYSVDAQWLVPHFEKMLYDNAQLMTLYLDGWRATGSERYRQVVLETADWLLREMRTPEGGFQAALDADSEGEEGLFYTWTPAEIDAVLPPADADLLKLHYGVTESGNFEGRSVLHLARPVSELAGSLGVPESEVETTLGRARATLLAAREGRVRPGNDAKVITSWNGLAIRALAEAGVAFDRPDLVEAATAAARCILERGIDADGRLARTLTGGVPGGTGMLEDHAFLADGLLALYAATGNHDWLESARQLVDVIVNDFAHEAGPGFYDTGAGHETLIIRPRELQDGATPCGNSVAIDVLLTLAHLTGDDALRGHVDSLLAALTAAMSEHPLAFGRFLAVLERTLAGERQVVLAGDDVSAFRTALLQRHEPFVTLAYVVADDKADTWPTLANRPLPAGAPTAAYVCQGMSCLPPVTDVKQLWEVLEREVR